MNKGFKETIFSILKNKYVYYSLLPFVILSILLIVQNLFVPLQFDDFGYGSLSYGYTLNTHGMNYNLSDIMSFLSWHYANWGGRVLFFFFEIILIKAGLVCIQLTQAFFMIGIVVFTFLIFRKNKEHNYILAILLCLAFGFINLEVLNDSTYWFTASAIYLWPLFFFLGAIFFHKLFSTYKKWYLFLFEILFIFIASFSQEQVAVGVICYSLCIFIYESISNKKVAFCSGISFILSLFGGLIVLLAPGNFVRMNNGDNAWFLALNLFEKLQHNVPLIVHNNFEPRTAIFSIFFMVSIVILSLITYFKYFKDNKLILFIISPLLILFITFISFLITLNQYEGFYFVFPFISLIYSFFLIVYLSIRTKNKEILGLAIFAFITQASLALSPTISLRCVLPFEVIYILVISYFISKIKVNNVVSYKKLVNICSVTFLTIISLCSLANYLNVCIGYGINYMVSIENVTILSYYQDYVDENNSLTLKKLPLENYCTLQPYNEGFDYIEYWMKNYYSIPYEVTFIWVNN